MKVDMWTDQVWLKTTNNNGSDKLVAFLVFINCLINSLTASPRYIRGCCLMLERRYGFRAGASVGKELFWKGSGWKTLHDSNTNTSQKR